jgi:hypothetical protein
MPKPNKKELGFLKKTAEIESSGGKNLDHREIASGIHKGTAAVGRYGLMPNTLDEIRNRMVKAGVKLDGIDLKNASKEQLADLVAKDKALEDSFATFLLRTIKAKGVDDTTANYMWEYGHNKIPAKEAVEKSPRTKKFLDIEGTARELLKKQQKEQQRLDDAQEPKLRPGPLAALRPVAKAIKDYTPGISDAAGAIEAVTGKDLITGEEKSGTDRAIGAGGALLAAVPFGFLSKFPAAALENTADDLLRAGKSLADYAPMEKAALNVQKLPAKEAGAFADEFIKDSVSKTPQFVPRKAEKLVEDVGLMPPKSNSIEDLGKYFSEMLSARKTAGQSVTDIPASGEELADIYSKGKK